MWPFGFKSKSYVGLDIGTSSIKVVQLKKKKDKILLENYGALKNYFSGERANLNIGGSIIKLDSEKVREMTEKVIKKVGITSKNAVSAVPVITSFVTLIKLPKMSKAEVEKAIPYEAKRVIPVPIKDVELDWNIVERGKDFRSTEVLLIAVPKDIIGKYKEIIEGVDLKLIGLEPESFSLARSLLQNNDKIKGSPTVIVDIGSRGASIVLTEEGNVRTIRNLNLSGNNLTNILSKSFGIDYTRAEDIKINQGLKPAPDNYTPEGQTRQLLSSSIDIIVEEILRMSNLYAQKGKKGVDKVILAGGSANLLYLPQYLKQKLNMNIEIGNPWKRISYPANLEHRLVSIGPSFAVAVGLALKGALK